MNYFQKIAEGIDVGPALAQLAAHPDLWGEYPERINAPGSPHVQSNDIWVRFRPRHELTAPVHYGEPHFAVFYPAWEALPALHPMVFGVMAAVSATYLGGILLTRIPAGAAILPHVDRGWHPSIMDTKAYVILQANEHCTNRCGGETVIMRAGEVWLFENQITHSVENNGDIPRIALIVTMRTK